MSESRCIELTKEEVDKRVANNESIYVGMCTKCTRQILIEDKSWFGICRECLEKEEQNAEEG